MLVEMPRSRSRLQNSSREIPAGGFVEQDGIQMPGVDASLTGLSR